jgi:hypothetical protein
VPVTEPLVTAAPPIINLAALRAAAAKYGAENNLPRVVGQSSEPLELDKDGKEVPIKIGKLIVAPEFGTDLEDQLLGILQDRFHAAACNISRVLDERGPGGVDEVWRVVPPIPGVLKVDTTDHPG